MSLTMNPVQVRVFTINVCNRTVFSRLTKSIEIIKSVVILLILVSPLEIYAQKSSHNPKNHFSKMKSQVDLSIEWATENFPLKIRVFQIDGVQALEPRKTITSELSEPLPKWLKNEFWGQFQMNPRQQLWHISTPHFEYLESELRI